MIKSSLLESSKMHAIIFFLTEMFTITKKPRCYVQKKVKFWVSFISSSKINYSWFFVDEVVPTF